MENKEIILTEHILLRWDERFPGELDGMDDVHRAEFIKNHIKESYNVLIQKDPDSKEHIIFVYKDFRIVLIAANTNTAITVFPTDYNHTPDIDKMIANQLYKKIIDIDAAITTDREKLETTIVTIDEDITTVDEQMRSLQRQMDQNKTKRCRLTAQKEECLKTFDVLFGERETIGRQLAYSVTYRMDNKPNELKRLDHMITTAIGSTSVVKQKKGR